MLATRTSSSSATSASPSWATDPDRGLGFVASDRRRDGYRHALQEAGIPVRRELQRAGPHDRLAAHRLTRELLCLPNPPTAILAASDTQALGVLKAACAESFAVPDDLSVVGSDDLEVAPYVGLTTVHQPLEESGLRGVRRLVAALATRTPRRTKSGWSSPSRSVGPLQLRADSGCAQPRCTAAHGRASAASVGARSSCASHVASSLAGIGRARK
jgi:hypothetical protein